MPSPNPSRKREGDLEGVDVAPKGGGLVGGAGVIDHGDGEALAAFGQGIDAMLDRTARVGDALKKYPASTARRFSGNDN